MASHWWKRDRRQQSHLLEGLESRVLMAATPVVTATTLTAAAWESRANAPTAQQHNGTIRLTRNGSLAQPLQVTLNITGTAVQGTNYTLLDATGTPLSGSTVTFTIPAGKSSAVLTVKPIEDAVVDPTLTVTATVATDPLTIYQPSTSRPAATVNILDSNPTITLVPVAGGLTEGGVSQPAFTIRRTAAPGGTLTATPALLNLGSTTGTFGTATNLTGAFVNSTTNLLTGSMTLSVPFAAGQTTQRVNLTTTDNLTANGTSTIVVQNIAGASPFTLGTLNVTDASPTVTLTTVTATTLESGNNILPGQFLIRRTGSTANQLDIPFTLANGSANGVRGVNYLLTYADGSVITSNSFTIRPGQSSVRVFVKAIDDQLNAAKTVAVTIPASTAFNLGTATGTVTITNTVRAPSVRQATALKLAALNKPIQLSFSDLIKLTGASLDDESHGPLQLQIGALTNGTLQRIAAGTLTPVAAAAGATFSQGDFLIWTPPLNIKLNGSQAFTVFALDGVTLSPTGTSIRVLMT